MLETDVGIHWDVNGTLNNLSADPVAEWLRTLISSALNRLSSHRCGYEPNSGHKPRSACEWPCGFSLGSPIFALTHN